MHWYKRAQTLTDLVPGNAWLGWQFEDPAFRLKTLIALIVSKSPKSNRLRVSVFGWYARKWLAVNHAEILDRYGHGVRVNDEEELLRFLQRRLKKLYWVRKVSAAEFESVAAEMQKEEDQPANTPSLV